MQFSTHPETGSEIRDNLFTDPFVVVINYYGDTQALEFSEERLVVSIRDSDDTTGFFKSSDIIIQYDDLTRMPKVVAERVYRNKYPYLQYLLWKRQWKNKVRASTYAHIPGSDITWKMRLSDCGSYFDIIYFDEEWFEWQKELQVRKQVSQLQS